VSARNKGAFSFALSFKKLKRKVEPYARRARSASPPMETDSEVWGAVLSGVLVRTTNPPRCVCVFTLIPS
jgi:hypothetical protein